MDHKHLLDTEIELLIDGDAGSEAEALVAHAGECDECRVALAQARSLARALSALPELAPSPGFANQVIARTRAITPWHVAARRAVEQAIAAAPGIRWIAAIGASTAGVGLAALTIWLAPRSDAVLFGAEIGLEWFWLEAVAAGRDIANAVLGAPTIGAIQQAGTLGLGVAAASLLVTALGTMAVLRAVATASIRARR